MKLEGVHHIALNVRDIDRAEEFYTDVLGFQVAKHFSKGLRHLMLDAGNVSIALFESPDLEMDQAVQLLSETGYMHFAFKTTRDQFESVMRELRDKHVCIDEGPVKRGPGESVYFNDPDGNHLEIHYDDSPET